VLFTDVVGSTELARELGDQRWSRLLAAQRRVVRAELKAHRGREVDTAGDGFFAIFEGPADAVRCAFSAVRKVQDLGLDIRAGIHFGEVEREGDHAHGIVVHTGARVMGQAGAAEVLITQTVKDLVAGARFGIAERGAFELKGVPGSWSLYDVLEVDDQPRPDPVEDATVASERRQRASAGPPPVVRRRWVLPVAIVAVLALIGVAFVVARPEPARVPGPGTVARIDGDRFDRPIPVGSFPLAITEGEGRVWVMDRQSQIYWVQESDDSTGSRGTVGVPTNAATGAGAVWITAGFGTGAGADGAVSRLDPSSGQITDAFDTPIGSQAIAYGADSVWVADPTTATVTRYDPVSQEHQPIALPRSDPPARPDAIAFGELGGAAVWVGDALSSNLYRVDAGGAHEIRTYTIGGPPTAIAVGTDAVWVASEHEDAIYALDPLTGSVRTSIDVGAQGCNGPASIAVNQDGVWVACAISRQVMRIDPSGGTVATSLMVAAVPIGLTTARDGSVWVAVQPS
jgi:streptogramin lyase